MSESLIHVDVIDQMSRLATLAGASCGDFQHQVIATNVQFIGPSFKTLFDISVAQNSGLVITALEVKVLFDTTDVLLGTGAADWRSTFDFNPYGPFSAGPQTPPTGQVTMSYNGVQQFATAWDFSVINMPVLFVAQGNTEILIQANPNQPAGAKIQLVSRLTTFTTQDEIVTRIKKNETRIVSTKSVT